MKQMSPEAAAETAALIADLWQRHLPTLLERLAILERIAVDSVAPLSKADHDEAIAISHKFAGSLGMYGYHDGSAAASKIEQLFRSGEPIESETLITLTTQLRESIFPTQP
jgi:HPt (histidine-containing phosphotransfer) domain-containing protein